MYMKFTDIILLIKKLGGLMNRIFIVEDDKTIRESLMQFLSDNGYETDSTTDFPNVINKILEANPSLVLLDINLPVYDGYTICREVRKKSNVPIIIVTSRDSEVDELISMNMGADDFVTKPYNPQILLARVSAVLKRFYNIESSKTFRHKDVTLDTSKGTVEYHGNTQDLTKNEMRIFYLLMKDIGKIVSRDDIMNDLWQSDEFVDDNTLTVNINRLRGKLKEIGIDDFIQTKRGQGYMICE